MGVGDHRASCAAPVLRQRDFTRYANSNGVLMLNFSSERID